MMLNDTSSRNPATVWLLAALAVAAVVAGVLMLVRSGSGTPVGPAEEWVTVGSVEEIEERDVVYVQEHDLFVATMVAEPEGFVALSAWIPAQMGGGGLRRMLYCTLSNGFENDTGTCTTGPDICSMASRVQRCLASHCEYETGWSRLLPRVPPATIWTVAPIPPGHRVARGAMSKKDRKDSRSRRMLLRERIKRGLHPTRLKVGQRAELHFARGPASGLSWGLYRLEENGLWQWRGILVGGPGYETYFDLAPLDPGGGIDDIAFGFSYSIDIQIPKLDPGTYRLATHSVRGGSRPVYERTEWHHADFEVIPD